MVIMTLASSHWRCKHCKRDNANDEEFCDNCLAPRKASDTPRETCRTCLHRHSVEKPCHVYVINETSWKRKVQKWSKSRRSDEGSLSSGSSASETLSALEQITYHDSDEDIDSDDQREGEKVEDEESERSKASSVDTEETDKSEDKSGYKKNSKQAGEKISPLSLRDRLAARTAGVAKRVEQAFRTAGRSVQHDAVGSVTIRIDPLVGDELEFENRPPLESMPPPPNVLRLFLEYMDASTVARCARTSTEWHQECYALNKEGKPIHPAYAGLHFMELESLFDACEDKIDGLFFQQPPRGDSGQLFTSGQRSVTAWKRLESPVAAHAEESSTYQQGGSLASGDSLSGKGEMDQRIGASWERVGVAVRDTAPFTKIHPVNNSIICCSSNGSIREWLLAHEVKNIRFLANMWEHSGYITDVTFAAPSVGYCKTHGAPAHSCYMYSVSDDRSLKVWDMASKKCLHTVEPQISDCGTLQSVAISDFHLYTGTSNGRIVVFALGRVCLRPERHRCQLHDEPRWFCEQESFKHDKEPVQHMVCGGPGGRYKYLFTAVRNGTIKVWNVPKDRFGHKEVCTFQQHKRAVTALAVTNAHLFSASDEGHVRIWSLGTLELQRVIGQKWRIKCIWVHHASTESPDAGEGNLFLGLATGSVLVYPITNAV